MKITFIGATHEVTGSCTLLENEGKYYLVDCGMEQGVDLYENEPLPVKPEEIGAVFVTHAHIDHTGMLPKLYKDGFRGQVFATEATCKLCRIMLMIPPTSRNPRRNGRTGRPPDPETRSWSPCTPRMTCRG